MGSVPRHCPKAWLTAKWGRPPQLPKVLILRTAAHPKGPPWVTLPQTGHLSLSSASQDIALTAKDAEVMRPSFAQTPKGARVAEKLKGKI